MSGEKREGTEEAPAASGSISEFLVFLFLLRSDFSVSFHDFHRLTLPQKRDFRRWEFKDDDDLGRSVVSGIHEIDFEFHSIDLLLNIFIDD